MCIRSSDQGYIQGMAQLDENLIEAYLIRKLIPLDLYIKTAIKVRLHTQEPGRCRIEIPVEYLPGYYSAQAGCGSYEAGAIFFEEFPVTPGPVIEN
jgi:hypothetical protein